MVWLASSPSVKGKSTLNSRFNVNYWGVETILRVLYWDLVVIPESSWQGKIILSADFFVSTFDNMWTCHPHNVKITLSERPYYELNTFSLPWKYINFLNESTQNDHYSLLKVTNLVLYNIHRARSETLAKVIHVSWRLIMPRSFLLSHTYHSVE